MAPNSLSLVVSGMKVDLLRDAAVQLCPPEVIDGLPLVSIPDLAAMKLNAIANRGSKKDFFDLTDLLETHSLAEMVEFFATKYQSCDPFTVIRNLAWFEEAEKEPDPLAMAGQTWEGVKATVREAVATL